MDIQPGQAAAAAGVGAAVAATLNAILVKYLFPRYLRAREDFEREMKDEAAALRERIDGIRQHVDAEFGLLRESWHKNNNEMNLTIGRIAGVAERNTHDIESLIEDRREVQHDVRSIDKSVAGMLGMVEGLSLSVKALTAAVQASAKA